MKQHLRKFTAVFLTIFMFAMCMGNIPVYAAEQVKIMTEEEMAALYTQTEDMLRIAEDFEDSSLRKKRSKIAKTGSGTYIEVVHTQPIHYLDENDDWQEIDTTVKSFSGNQQQEEGTIQMLGLENEAPIETINGVAARQLQHYLVEEQGKTPESILKNHYVMLTAQSESIDAGISKNIRETPEGIETSYSFNEETAMSAAGGIVIKNTYELGEGVNVYVDDTKIQESKVGFTDAIVLTTEAQWHILLDPEASEKTKEKDVIVLKPAVLRDATVTGEEAGGSILERNVWIEGIILTVETIMPTDGILQVENAVATNNVSSEETVAPYTITIESTSSYYSNKDAYVYSGGDVYGTGGNGDRDIIKVGRNTESGSYRSYIYWHGGYGFDPNIYDLDQAVVRLYYSGYWTGGSSIYNYIFAQAVQSSWSESSISWNSQPSVRSLETSTVSVSGTTYGNKEWDITAIMQDCLNNDPISPNIFQGIVLKDLYETYYGGNRVKYFHSRENTSDPTLILQYSEKPNNAPTIPYISGPTSGHTDTYYYYQFLADDYDGDDIVYEIKWDALNSSTKEARGPYDEGQYSPEISHHWSSPSPPEGYCIQARSYDSVDYSNWSNCHNVDIESPNTDPYSPSNISGPVTCPVNQYCEYNVYGGDPDTNDRLKYKIDYEDGVTSWTESFVDEYTWSPDLSIKWTTPGFKDLKAQAMDDDGGLSYWSSTKLTVEVEEVNQPPVAHAGNDQTVQIAQGQTSIWVTLDGIQSYDPDGIAINAYDWGTTTPGAPIPDNHPYPQVNLQADGQNSKTYIFTLRVQDNPGDWSNNTDTVEITVNPPDAALEPDIDVNPNQLEFNQTEGEQGTETEPIIPSEIDYTALEAYEGLGTTNIVPFDKLQKNEVENTVPEEFDRFIIRRNARYFVPQKDINISFQDGSAYVFLQLNNVLSDAQVAEITSIGVILETKGNGYYLAGITETNLQELTNLLYFQGVETIHSFDKMPQWVYEGNIPGYSKTPDGRAILAVVFYPSVSLSDGEILLTSIGGDDIGDAQGIPHALHVSVPMDNIMNVAEIPQVAYVSEIAAPLMEDNGDAQAASHIDVLHDAPYNLDGAGVSVMVRDGMRTADHPDFGNRLTIVEMDFFDCTPDANGNSSCSHPTHVAGTIGGSGLGNNQAEGMAPDVQNIFSYYFNGLDFDQAIPDAVGRGASISNHSYGSALGWSGTTWYGNTHLFAHYSGTTRTWDQTVKDNGAVVVKSAGNDRNDTGDGTNPDDPDACVGHQGVAKNIITVGAVEDNLAMTAFSCWGPTEDGRIKPDIVSNGVSLLSPIPGNDYGRKSGTSMASPVVTGAIALITQQYQILNDNENPPNDLVKALLIDTADDLGRQGPDYEFGFGGVNIQDAIDRIRDDNGEGKNFVTGNITDNVTKTYYLEVNGEDELKGTMVWMDEPADADATETLVNDLDLVFIDPDGIRYYPFTLDGDNPTALAVSNQANHIDNVEQVLLSNPVDGWWKVEVSESNLDTNDQEFALILNVPYQSNIQSFNISNTGDANLTINNITKQNNSDWLTVSPPVDWPITITPNNSITVKVGVNVSNLSVNTYTDRLIISSNDPDENPYPDGVDITLNVLENQNNNDADAPFTIGHSPLQSAVDVPAGSNIAVQCKDTNSGVDSNTLSMQVDHQDGNGYVDVLTNGAAQGSYVVDITSIIDGYIIEYNPENDLPYSQQIGVKIDAKDLANNIMAQDSYSFTTEDALPPIPETKLLASDGVLGDNFGGSVSVDNNIAVVGAHADDDLGDSSGTAYVYRREGGDWIEEAKLIASDGEGGDQFGFSVAVSGDVALIGARGDNDNGFNAGAAYVYRRDGTNWVEEVKLLASDGAMDDLFGRTVAVTGNVALVGAAVYDHGSYAGAVYVYRWDGASWVEEAKLLASDGADKDNFGTSLSISGDRALIGASQNEDQGDLSGSAYMFKWNGTNWVEEAKLLASDGAYLSFFGYAVAVDGDLACIGARGAGGVGNQTGAAYVYRWDGSNWNEEAKLLASDGADRDFFGGSVSISGDFVLVGAKQDQDQGDGWGATYLYQWDGTSWSQETKLLASDGATNARFGTSVSLSGETALVGAYNSDNGNGENTGAAYIYELGPGIEEPQITDFTPKYVPNDWDSYEFTVTITGDNFDGGNTVVKFGSEKQAIIDSLSNDQIVVHLPANSKTGPITVITDGGQIQSSEDFVVENRIDIIPENPKPKDLIQIDVNVHTSDSSCDIILDQNHQIQGNTIITNMTTGQQGDFCIIVPDNRVGTFHIGSLAEGTHNVKAYVNGELHETNSFTVNPSADPVLHYTFNEGSGEIANDISGMGNHGTIVGAAWDQEGLSGSTLDFDGVDDYVNAGVRDNLQFGSEESFSIETWIKPEASGEYQHIAGDGYLSYRMGLEYGKPDLRVGMNNLMVTADEALPLNIWTHVVATYDAGTKTVKIYVDGQEVKSGSNPEVVWESGDRPFSLANTITESYYYTGSLDELRVYTEALEATEILIHYNAEKPENNDPPPPPPRGKVGYWKFDEGSGIYANDASENGYTGQINGATWDPKGVTGSTLNFNGEDSMVDVGIKRQLQFGSEEAFSMETWIKPTNRPIYQHLAGDGYLTYRLGLWEGKIDLRLGLNNLVVTGDDPVALNEWSHVVATYDPATKTVRLYVNGTEVKNGNNAALSWESGDRPFSIGNTIGEYYHFTGAIDEVRVYNEVLDASTVSQHYQSEKPASIPPPAPGKVADWKFDEGSGTVAGDSEGNNNGQIDGATWEAEGVLNTALTFDGTDDSIDMGIKSDLQYGSEDSFTIETWVKPSGTKEYAHLAGDGYLTYRMGLLNGKPDIRLGLNALVVTADEALPLNYWSSYVASYDGETKTAKLYVNGVEIKSVSNGSLNWSSGDRPFSIGNTIGEYYYFDGSIDEVRVYNTVLDPAEIMQHYIDENPQMGPPTPSLTVGDWKFDETSGGTAADSSEYGHEGTVHGAVFGVGKINNGLTFDGEDDYIDMGVESRLGFSSTDNFTIAMWLKPDGFTEYQHLAGDGFLTYRLGINNGNLDLRVGMNSLIVTADEPLQLNQWNFVTGVYDASTKTIKLYLNGVEIKSGTNGSLDWISDIRPFTIGQTIGEGYNYWGIMDEVRVYHEALSAEEVSTLYNQ